MLKSIVDNKDTERRNAAATTLAAAKAANETERKTKDTALKAAELAFKTWDDQLKELRKTKSKVYKNAASTA